MSFDPVTKIFKSPLPDIAIPSDLSIYEFMFYYRSPEGTPFPRARTAPDNALWLIDSLTGRSLTFHQTHARTLAIAAALKHRYDIGHDDVVSFFSGNEVDYATALWGTFRLGGICSCANPSYGAGELGFQLKLVNEHKKAKVLLTHPDSLPVAIEAVKQAGLSQDIIVLLTPPTKTTDLKLAASYKSLDDLIASTPSNFSIPPVEKIDAHTKLAFLSFSSGTTGLPKAVEIHHRAVISNVLQMMYHFRVTSDYTTYDPVRGTGEKVLGVLPFYHIYGLVVVLHTSVFLNTPVVVLNKFTLDDFCGTIQNHKVTMLYIVPPQVVLMVKNPAVDKYDLSSARLAMSGAAPLSEETSIALKKKYPKIVVGQGYGMTETCTVISCFPAFPREKINTGSAGILIPNVEAKVIDSEGNALGPRGVGELISRSPSNALGYLGNEKATKETFDSEGFVHTGDEVYIDEKGNLFVLDRIKELIKVKGNQVAPAELEGFLLEHEYVSDVAVIGIQDDYAGEIPKAYVVKSAAATNVSDDAVAQALKDFVAKNKIAYKQIKLVEFIDVIPKTASGKILRKDLRVLHAKTHAKAAKI